MAGAPVSLTAAVLRKMQEKGLSIADAIELAELWEQGASMAVPEPTSAALRQRRYRERKRDGDATRDATSDVVGETPSRAQVVTPFSSSLRSEEVGGGGGGECGREPADDWPGGKAPDLARLLVETVASPRLDPAKSQGLVTTAGRLAAWRRDGASWEHDVVPVVTAICAKQRSPVSTWKFFDAAIARSIADNAAALDIPEAGSVRATGPPSITAQIGAEWAEARRRVLES